MEQYRVGDIKRIDIDQARVALLESQSALAGEQVGLIQSQVALFRAMGRGWQMDRAVAAASRSQQLSAHSDLSPDSRHVKESL